MGLTPDFFELGFRSAHPWLRASVPAQNARELPDRLCRVEKPSRSASCGVETAGPNKTQGKLQNMVNVGLRYSPVRPDSISSKPRNRIIAWPQLSAPHRTSDPVNTPGEIPTYFKTSGGEPTPSQTVRYRDLSD